MNRNYDPQQILEEIRLLGDWGFFFDTLIFYFQ